MLPDVSGENWQRPASGLQEKSSSESEVVHTLGLDRDHLRKFTPVL